MRRQGARAVVPIAFLVAWQGTSVNVTQRFAIQLRPADHLQTFLSRRKWRGGRERLLYQNLRMGEIPSWEEEEEEEECMLSGQVMRPSEFSPLDLLHPALPGQQQLQVFAIHGVGQPPPPPPPRPLQPPPRPRQQAVVPGIGVTVLIYDLETTG